MPRFFSAYEPLQRALFGLARKRRASVSSYWSLNRAKGTTQLFTFITLLAADAVLYLYSAAAIAAAIKDQQTADDDRLRYRPLLRAFRISTARASKPSCFRSALLATGVVIYVVRRPRIRPAEAEA